MNGVLQTFLIHRSDNPLIHHSNNPSSTNPIENAITAEYFSRRRSRMAGTANHGRKANNPNNSERYGGRDVAVRELSVRKEDLHRAVASIRSMVAFGICVFRSRCEEKLYRNLSESI
ncbi:MAG: hypothetical protein HUU32_07110 [Calditrichaceae bacterium]|nr:hypothetical protein [Calditrichia bacterium]NUQ41148.1 hypothetical protein [Calditrichaceae bacterium]